MTPSPRAFAPAALRWRIVALLAALFVLRGVMLACVMPPFEGWDEISHLAYIDHYAHTGKPALYGQTMIDPAFLAAAFRFPQPQAISVATGYRDYWAGQRTPAWAARIPTDIYEAQQTPLYYWMAAPLYRACGGRQNLVRAVAVLRLVNLALATAALTLQLAWIRQALAGRLALAAACWVAFQPLLLLNASRVANDALAYLLGTLVVIVCLAPRRDGWRNALALAALLPLACWAKTTNLALVPLSLAALVFPAQPAVPLGRRLMDASLLLLCTAAALAPYFLFNLRHFGLLVPMQEAVQNRLAGRTFAQVVHAAPWEQFPGWIASWWLLNDLWVGGWSFLQLPTGILHLHAALLLISAVPLLWGLLHREGRRQFPLGLRRTLLILLLVCSFHAALTIHAIESYSARAGGVFTNPWYMAVALPWLLLLLATSAGQFKPIVARIVLLASVPVLDVTVESFGLARWMIPFYGGSDRYAVALQRLATLHPVCLGTVTFAVAVSAAVFAAGALVAITVQPATSPRQR